MRIISLRAHEFAFDAELDDAIIQDLLPEEVDLVSGGTCSILQCTGNVCPGLMGGCTENTCVGNYTCYTDVCHSDGCFGDYCGEFACGAQSCAGFGCGTNYTGDGPQ